MAQIKKDFLAEAAGAFVDTMIAPTAAPKPAKRQTAAPAPAPYSSGVEVKATFMLDAEIERKLRYIAYTERGKQKRMVNDALAAYIAKWEKAHGKID